MRPVFLVSILLLTVGVFLTVLNADPSLEFAWNIRTLRLGALESAARIRDGLWTLSVRAKLRKVAHDFLDEAFTVYA